MWPPGTVLSTVGDSRTEDDFAAFLDGLLGSVAPEMRWRIVCDNLNTHLSESVVRLVARHCGINWLAPFEWSSVNVSG